MEHLEESLTGCFCGVLFELFCYRILRQEVKHECGLDVTLTI